MVNLEENDRKEPKSGEIEQNIGKIGKLKIVGQRAGGASKGETTTVFPFSAIQRLGNW